MDLFRILPAALVVLLGCAFLTAGVRSGPANWRRTSGPRRAMAYVSAFRRFAIGLCLIAGAIGWAEDVSWLVAAATCIGIGETLETTYYTVVLRSRSVA